MYISSEICVLYIIIQLILLNLNKQFNFIDYEFVTNL